MAEVVAARSGYFPSPFEARSGLVRMQRGTVAYWCAWTEATSWRWSRVATVRDPEMPHDQGGGHVAWMGATPPSRTATPARRARVSGRLGRRSRPNWSTRSEASCWPATVRPMGGRGADLGKQQEHRDHVGGADQATQPSPPRQPGQRPQPRLGDPAQGHAEQYPASTARAGSASTPGRLKRGVGLASDDHRHASHDRHRADHCGRGQADVGDAVQAEPRSPMSRKRSRIGGLPALGCAQEDAARSRIARSTALGSVVSKSISLAHSGVTAMRAICL